MDERKFVFSMWVMGFATGFVVGGIGATVYFIVRFASQLKEFNP